MLQKSKEKRAPKPGKVGAGKFWAWSSREFPETANVLLMGYFMFYCTNTLHLNPVTVGLLLGASKIVDAITDIFAGYIVDITNLKMGKGRPYELTIIGTWVCTFFMFNCPAGFSETAKYVWVLAMYIMINAVFMTFANAGENVYMIRAFSQEQVVRVSSYIGIVSSLAGMVVNIILPQLIEKYAGVAGGWSKIVCYIGIPLVIIGMMRFLFIKEEYNADTSAAAESLNIKESILVLNKNKYVWFIVAGIFIGQLGSQIGLQTYYFQEIFGSVGMASYIAMVSFVAIPLVFLFPRLIKKYKVRNVVLLGSVLSVVGSIICFISNKNFVLYIVGYLFIGAGALPGTYLTRLMSYDCSAYNEYMGMPRMEGTLGAIQGFAKRLGAAASASLGGIFLGLIGYDSEAVTSGAVMGLRVGQTILPAVCSVIGIAVLLGYHLDEKMDEINAENAARREGAKSNEKA